MAHKKGSSVVDREARFDTGYSVVPITGCWMWLGSLTHESYAILVSRRPRKILAHRYAYERFVGKIGEEQVIDHLCRNPWCVNPAHLEAVSNETNVLRGMSPPACNRRKFECVHGHDLTGDNARISPEGWRECRACDRRNALNRYHRKRALRHQVSE